MKEINKIYLVYFLVGFTNIASVTFTLYFLSHGLSQAQIGQLFGIFMITMAIVNIPSGAFADIYGHKLSVAIGLLFQSLNFLLFFAFPNYLGFLLGFLASGVGLAFQTGATSSLIYEILHKEGIHEDFQKYYGRANGYFLVGAIIGSLIGGFIYKYNPRFPYIFSFFLFLAAFIVTIFIKWEFTKKQNNLKTYLNVLTDGIKLTFKNKVLIGIIVLGSGLTISRLVFNQNIVQPYQLRIGLDVSLIGVTAAVISAVSALISYNSQKIYKILGKEMAILLIIFITSFTAIALGFINSLISLPLLLLFVSGHALRDPVFSHITQEEVDRDKRSTMSSTVAFLTAIIAGVTLPYFGKGIDMFGMNSILFVLGLFTFVIGIFGFFILSSKRKAVL